MSKSTYGTGENNPHMITDFQLAECSGDGFIKFLRTLEAEELLKEPACFLLLSQIALRARRSDTFNSLGLTKGQAVIGDYLNIGLTEQKYRTAKRKLVEYEFITVKSTNKGTIATLIDKRIYDIDDALTNEQLTNKQRTTNEQTTTSKNVKNDKNERLSESEFFDSLIKDYPILQTDSFLFAWSEWEQYRKLKKKPLTSISLKKQIQFLSNQPNPVYCIEQSIRNGWEGLFEDKGGGNGQKKAMIIPSIESLVGKENL